MKAAMLGTIVSAVCAITGVASAQNAFPERPVEVTIPFSPGDTDNMLRPFVERMGNVLGKPVVFQYKPGAGGAIGARDVATRKPDGYALIGTSPGSIVVAPLITANIAYSLKSFAPVAALSEGGLLMVVQASSPWKTLGDLVAHAKAHPDKITFSTSGAKGITHMLGEAFASAANIKLTHIPYKGSAEAIVGLLGGQIDMASTAIGPALGHIRTGDLRPLAVFADERLKALPDVPTVREAGYDVGHATLYGLLAPAGTPRDVIDKLYGAAKVVAQEHEAEITRSLAPMGAQIHVLGPDEYTTYLAEQDSMYSAAAADLKN